MFECAYDGVHCNARKYGVLKSAAARAVQCTVVGGFVSTIRTELRSGKETEVQSR
jgi:hypothetical protein